MASHVLCRCIACVLKTIESDSFFIATVYIDNLISFYGRRKYFIYLKKMFYSHELLSLRQKGRLARCWLAATVNEQIFKQMCKSSTMNGINLCDLCEEIINIIQTNSNETNRRFSLYLSSQLMYGAVKILLYQTTNLQNQAFQIDKKALYYRKYKMYEVQNASAHFELCNITSVINDYNVVELDNSLPVLQGKSNINNKMEVMMHDATCLDFGVLSHEQLNFLHPNDEDISLKVLDRMHITNPHLDGELNDVFSYNEKILTDLEKSDLSMDRSGIEISISPIHDDRLGDQEHQVTFVKRMLPEVTMEEMESRRSDLLTPPKRQPDEEKHTETPSKKRRLRFEDAVNADQFVASPVLGTEVVSVSAIDHTLELLQDLEPIQENSLQIGRKSSKKKKKIFVDKITKLNHKAMRKWLNNVNAHTVSLNVINVNMPTSEILFKTPSTNFTSIYETKWNNSLNALFHMHTAALSGRNIMQMEYGQLLEKSTEFTRFEDKSNKTEELFSELSSAFGKSVELSKNVTSEKNITIAMDEFPEVLKIYDITESTTDIPGIILSPEITENTVISDTSHNSSKPLPFCLLTKRELLVLLEIVWQNTDFAIFNNIISPDNYSKLDAASCFMFLLELYKEKRIILKQAAPYDIIWIQKCV
ncbi:hypothetical protein KPH14_010316 [Odynerus spinipes]|uniref:Rad21/Rec8-like protein N-terminal domain-containing protein n=1 Tax=Odynerus spinipes TaxID=1348599 RepID=A0AAD9RU19_9HYME|nr:hypothetical protein KPH14_010316 [Odynerus spinipes]